MILVIQMTVVYKSVLFVLWHVSKHSAQITFLATTKITYLYYIEMYFDIHSKPVSGLFSFNSEAELKVITTNECKKKKKMTANLKT